jgi:hypothetical protein
LLEEPLTLLARPQYEPTMYDDIAAPLKVPPLQSENVV